VLRRSSDPRHVAPASTTAWVKGACRAWLLRARRIRSPCMVTLLPSVARPALASALPRRRSLCGRPCQVTAVRGLVALRVGLLRAAAPQFHLRTPESRAFLGPRHVLLAPPVFGSRSSTRTRAPAPAPPPFLPLTGMAATARLGRAGALGSPGPGAAFLSSSVIAAYPGQPASSASAPHPHASFRTHTPHVLTPPARRPFTPLGPQPAPPAPAPAPAPLATSTCAHPRPPAPSRAAPLPLAPCRGSRLRPEPRPPPRLRSPYASRLPCLSAALVPALACALSHRSRAARPPAEPHAAPKPAQRPACRARSSLPGRTPLGPSRAYPRPLTLAPPCLGLTRA
jgi:hypothetical protein